MTLSNIGFSNNYIHLRNKPTLKYELPIVKVSLDRKADSSYIVRKMNNSKRVINSQLDTLLLAGFQGTSDDFKKLYKRNELYRKRRQSQRMRYNSSILLKLDLLSKPIKLTKIKEFNFMDKKENKIKNLKKVLNIYKIKNENKDNKDGNKEKKEYEKNIGSNSAGEIYSKNSCISMDSNNHYKTNKIDKIDKNRIIKREMIKSSNMKRINKMRIILNQKSRNLLNLDNNNRALKSQVIEIKKFHHIIDDKENKDNKDDKENKDNIDNQNNKENKEDIENIDKNLKNKIKEKTNGKKGRNKVRFNYNKSSDDINKIFNKYLKKKDNKMKIKKILDPLTEGFRENLKELKMDKGRYIWIKRSTANLISFGNSFKLMADDIFYKEHKQIIEKYPNIEKEAKIIVPRKKIIKNKEIINKLENNEKTIRNIFANTDRIMKGILSKSMNFSKSQS